MTLNELRSTVENAVWFSRLGTAESGADYFALSDIDTWNRVDFDWLPSSRDQEDPIHGSIASSKNSANIELYKLAMTSLRAVNHKHSGLVCGPHDFTEAARGAALFAVQRATLEIEGNLSDQFWCRAVELYHSGHWPCGITDNGKLVVL